MPWFGRYQTCRKSRRAQDLGDPASVPGMFTIFVYIPARPFSRADRSACISPSLSPCPFVHWSPVHYPLQRKKKPRPDDSRPGFGWLASGCLVATAGKRPVSGDHARMVAGIPGPVMIPPGSIRERGPVGFRVRGRPRSPHRAHAVGRVVTGGRQRGRGVPIGDRLTGHYGRSRGVRLILPVPAVHRPSAIVPADHLAIAPGPSMSPRYLHGPRWQTLLLT